MLQNVLMFYLWEIVEVCLIFFLGGGWVLTQDDMEDVNTPMVAKPTPKKPAIYKPEKRYFLFNDLQFDYK